MRFSRLAVVAVNLSVTTETSWAQTIVAPPPRFGIVGGINWATVRGPDADDAGWRTALMGGVTLVAPFTPSFALQPEFIYTQKGSRVTEEDFTGTVKMNYIEVPVMLRFDIATTSGPRPFLYAGPAVAFRVGCGVELKNGGDSFNAECDEGTDQPDFKSTDYSVVLGGGFAFNALGRLASIGVRYDHGLSNFSESNEVKHRVLSVIGTFEFPFRR